LPTNEAGLVMEVAGPQSILPAFPVSSKILGVQPSRLENLDDLLAQAEHYANHSMRNIGHLPPTLFLIGSKGPVMFMPESLADESEKDDFATTARLMCIAHAATACVMALEAWVKSFRKAQRQVNRVLDDLKAQLGNMTINIHL